MMGGKLLFVASTRSHIMHFHLPYLCGLREMGWTVHGAWGNAEAEEPCVEQVLPLPFEKNMGSLSNFRAALLIRKQIRKERYDLIVVHTSLAAFFARLAVWGMKKRPRVINMVHGYLFDDRTPALKRLVLLWAERLTARQTDLLLTMNAWDYETAVRHRLGKVVENVPGIGVDFERLNCGADESQKLRQSLGIAPDAFVMIYPAEFSARKSQETLLRAMTRLPEQVVLVLPGSGVLLEECKELAETLGVAHRVRFPGYVTNMGVWYAAANVAVSSSRSEGLPFNIMEAMYCGLPVVASEVKGHTDLISRGESGLLYPYGDWQSCARCVQRMMENPDAAQSMAQRGKNEMERYCLSHVYPQVMEKYASIMKEI